MVIQYYLILRPDRPRRGEQEPSGRLLLLQTCSPGSSPPPSQWRGTSIESGLAFSRQQQPPRHHAPVTPPGVLALTFALGLAILTRKNGLSPFALYYCPIVILFVSLEIVGNRLRKPW